MALQEREQQGSYGRHSVVAPGILSEEPQHLSNYFLKNNWVTNPPIDPSGRLA